MAKDNERIVLEPGQSVDFGSNCRLVVGKDGACMIRFMPDETSGHSGGGKSLRVATTGGNQYLELPNGDVVAVGLNVFKPLDREQWSASAKKQDDKARKIRREANARIRALKNGDDE